MTEKFSQLRQAVTESILEQRREQSEDSRAKNEDKRKLLAIAAEYEHLKASPVIEAMREAGMILSKASRSEVFIYITENPLPKDDERRAWEYFYRDPKYKLSTKISAALIWDIRTEDLRGNILDRMEWKEIAARVKKDDSGEISGYVLTFGDGEVETELSKESVFEAMDKAASNPVVKKGDRHKKEYEHHRIRFQHLERWKEKWELEKGFIESTSQPQQRYIVR